MIERFAAMPSALREAARWVRLAEDEVAGGVPALVAHPDWKTPAPLMVWMHGRTVHKELDPGRYLRWLRAGIGVCALDLPGHGERREETLQEASMALEVIERMLREVDPVMRALGEGEFGRVFDAARMGLGGMSAGGMVTLRRLCEPHGFVCAAVESTAGDFSQMAGFQRADAAGVVSRLDPMRHVAGWRPIPLMALHSEKDEWTPVGAIRRFTERLAQKYAGEGADAGLVELVTWPETGAPNEHSGFGRVSNDAKNLQTAFLSRWLLGKNGSE